MADKTVMLQLDITSDTSDAVRAADDVSEAYADMGTAIDKAAGNASAAESKLGGVADASDATATATAQAAGGLGDLGGALQLMPGPAAKVGLAMEAAAPAIMGVTGAADLANVVTEKLRLTQIKTAVSTAFKTAKDRVAAAATKAFAVAQLALNAVMSANPIALVVIAIAALVAAFVIAYKKSDTFRRIVDKAFGAVKRVVVGTVNTVVDFVRKHWKTGLLLLLTGPFGLAYLAVRKYGGKIRDAVVGAFNKVRDYVLDVGRKIVGYVSDAWTRAYTWTRDKVGQIKDRALDAFRGVIDWLRGFPADVVGFVSRAFDGARDKALTAVDKLREGVSTRFDRLLGIVGGLPRRILRGLGNMGTLLLDAGRDIIEGLIDGIEDMMGELRDKLGGITDLIPDIKGPPERDRKLLRPAGQLIMEGLLAGFDDRVGRMRTQLRRLTAEIRASVQASTADPVQLSLVGGSSAAQRQATTLVQIAVQGAIDPVSTAKQIKDLLERDASWRGRVVTTP